MAMGLQARLFRLLFAMMGLAVLVSACLVAVTVYYKDYRTNVTVMSRYMHERGIREGELFDDLTAAQLAASEHFLLRYQSLDEATAYDWLDTYVPLSADGTRRSIDGLYDGVMAPGFGPIYRMAVFVSANEAMTAERARTLVAAIQTIASLAPMAENELESLWFSTQLDIVIFSPTREDNLIFYRKTAPAEFEMSAAPFLKLSGFERNPEGRTLCTPLSRLMYVESGEALTTGCQTPMRQGDHQFGVWGTTLPMGEVFSNALNDLPSDSAELFFISAQGEIIAHKDLLGNPHVRREDVDRVEAHVKPQQLVKSFTEIRKHSSDDVLILQRRFGDVDIAYHLTAPDWYLVLHLSNESFIISALRNLLPYFFVSFLIVAICLIVFMITVREIGVKPLVALAERFAPEDENEEWAVSDDTPYVRRRDEVGELARALSGYKHQMESYTSDLETRIAQRTRELADANAAKSRFLATISHELRTPMNGILGIVGVLNKSEINDNQREMVNLITDSAVLLERQLTDILDVSKIEAGHMELSVEAFNLREAIQTTAALYSVHAREKELNFEVSVAPECDAMFLGDAVRIRQVLTNLLSNALKFTQSGSISVTVWQETEKDGKAEIRMVVKDTGVGIPESALKEIFSPFSQANGSVYSTYGGTGLGLSICRSLLELMNGTITPTSKVAEGTTFDCRFEIVRCEASTITPEAPKEEELIAVNTRVLLAEDHSVNRRVMELILTPLGFELMTVTNGQEAVDAAKAAPFDLIIMDILMPVKDGLEAIQDIREIEEQEKRPASAIIALSANASDADREASADAGADMHVAKPITPERIIAAISEVLIQNEAKRSVD